MTARRIQFKTLYLCLQCLMLAIAVGWTVLIGLAIQRSYKDTVDVIYISASRPRYILVGEIGCGGLAIFKQVASRVPDPDPTGHTSFYLDDPRYAGWGLPDYGGLADLDGRSNTTLGFRIINRPLETWGVVMPLAFPFGLGLLSIIVFGSALIRKQVRKSRILRQHRGVTVDDSSFPVILKDGKRDVD